MSFSIVSVGLLQSYIPVLDPTNAWNVSFIKIHEQSWLFFFLFLSQLFKDLGKTVLILFYVPYDIIHQHTEVSP